MTSFDETLRSRLQLSLGDGYTLDRELGGGGMSRVFLAHEAALKRDIVVKLLSPELAADINVERFTRETLLAASLQQANIVPVLRAGTSDGLPWYTMPYVDGRSVRDRLHDGALPLNEVLGILRDVGRALVYAHARGVVHRDIKPDNVLLSGGTAVVTDFGIAKALRMAQAATAPITLTGVGHSIGTPAYMAPEQIAGDPNIDARADLYAFGCLAYELLTGQAPFAGLAPAQLLAAQISTMPTAVEQQRPDTPRALAVLVTQCLAKAPDDRPSSARDVLLALESSSIDRKASFTPSTARRTRGLVAAGLAIALALTGGLLWKGAGAGSSSTEASIAVLPFALERGDAAQQYLADGVTEELITALSRAKPMRVIARSMAFRYRGVDPRRASKELDVSSVLTGSIRHGDRGLHVSAELTRTDGSLLWSKDFDEDSTQLLPIEREIVQASLAALGVTLSSPARDGLARRTQVDPIAHDLYMRGRFFWTQRSQDGMQRAIELYRQAIDRDPRNTLALSGLADAYAVSSFYSYLSPQDGYGRAKTIARQALAIDSTLAEPIASLGYIGLYFDWDWEAAGHLFRRSIAIDSTYATAHQWYGNWLLAMNRPQDGIVELQRAEQIDPANRISTGAVCWGMVLAHRSAEAIVQCQRALDLDSMLVVAYLWRGQAREQLRDTTAALRDLQSAVRLGKRSAITVAGLAHAEATFGQRESAMTLLRELESSTVGYRPSYEIATVYAALGERDQAIAYLERAVSERSHSVALLRIDPALDKLRDDPRLAAIGKRVGLP